MAFFLRNPAAYTSHRNAWSRLPGPLKSSQSTLPRHALLLLRPRYSSSTFSESPLGLPPRRAAPTSSFPPDTRRPLMADWVLIGIIPLRSQPSQMVTPPSDCYCFRRRHRNGGSLLPSTLVFAHQRALLGSITQSLPALLPPR